MRWDRCAFLRDFRSAWFNAPFGWRAMRNWWCCRVWDNCGRPGCGIARRRRMACTAPASGVRARRFFCGAGMAVRRQRPLGALAEHGSAPRAGGPAVRTAWRAATGGVADLWAPEEPLADNARRVELAVSFAATLVADFCRRRSPAVLAIAAAQSICLAGRAAGPFSRQAFVALALAEASPAAPLSSLRNEALSRIGPDVELIVISTRKTRLRNCRNWPRR